MFVLQKLFIEKITKILSRPSQLNNCLIKTEYSALIIVNIIRILHGVFIEKCIKLKIIKMFI